MQTLELLKKELVVTALQQKLGKEVSLHLQQGGGGGPKLILHFTGII